MNSKSPSMGKLIFLKVSLLEKYEILKKLDSEIEELVDLEDLTDEFETQDIFETSIQLTKLRMDQFFPDLQKYSIKDVVKIAPE